MAIEECITKSQEKKPVPDDKFDRHMIKARENDIDSRKKTFVKQTEQSVIREQRNSGFKSSVY